MKIAFDAQPLTDGQKTGVGFCAAGLSQAIINAHQKDLFTLSFFCFGNSSQKEVQLQPYCGNNVQIKVCNWISAGMYKLIWTFIPMPYSWFFGRNANIAHFFNFHVPPGVHGKKVSTVHDMAYKAFPETVRFKTKIMLNLSLKTSCRRADKIIAVSEFSKQELMKYLPVPPEKIIVVPNGVDLNFFRPEVERSQIEIAKSKYGITQDYFLYLGTLEPRKNLVRLIEAYAMLVKKLPNAPLLVLAGRKGWMYDQIFAKVTELRLESNVLFTGYIEDVDAPILLNGATAFVFPSLYEGFGMPPLEAMACGTPVLTSNAASLPEVVDDAAFLVDPYSLEELCDGMLQLATDTHLRKSLKEKGITRAQLFTWESAASKLYTVYEELMKE